MLDIVELIFDCILEKAVLMEFFIFPATVLTVFFALFQAELKLLVIPFMILEMVDFIPFQIVLTTEDMAFNTVEMMV